MGGVGARAFPSDTLLVSGVSGQVTLRLQRPVAVGAVFL